MQNPIERCYNTEKGEIAYGFYAKKEERAMNKKAVRVVCWILAALMIVSVLSITIPTFMGV